MTPRMAAVTAVLILSIGCAARHGRPIFGGSVVSNPSGTIAGIVRTTTGMPLPGRTVSAVSVASEAHFDATTASNGGYTIQVPVGEYRLELTLSGGEVIAKQPGPTKVNLGDVDEGLDFVIGR